MRMAEAPIRPAAHDSLPARGAQRYREGLAERGHCPSLQRNGSDLQGGGSAART